MKWKPIETLTDEIKKSNEVLLFDPNHEIKVTSDCWYTYANGDGHWEFSLELEGFNPLFWMLIPKVEDEEIPEDYFFISKEVCKKLGFTSEISMTEWLYELFGESSSFVLEGVVCNFTESDFIKELCFGKTSSLVSQKIKERLEEKELLYKSWISYSDLDGEVWYYFQIGENNFFKNQVEVLSIYQSFLELDKEE